MAQFRQSLRRIISFGERTFSEPKLVGVKCVVSQDDVGANCEGVKEKRANLRESVKD